MTVQSVMSRAKPHQNDLLLPEQQITVESVLCPLVRPVWFSVICVGCGQPDESGN